MDDNKPKVIDIAGRAGTAVITGNAATMEHMGIPMPMVLAEGFGDPETMLNSRDWLQAACEAKGAKMVGGGYGMGAADIDIELEGCRFNITIRPQTKP